MTDHEKALDEASKAVRRVTNPSLCKLCDGPHGTMFRCICREKARAAIAAFLRAVEPSGNMIEAMHDGSVNVPPGEYTGVFRSGCRALAEEIDNEAR